MQADAVSSLPPLREVIARYGLANKKSLGQHFLLDLNLTRKIARGAAALDGTVIEIGPGPGGLTRALLIEGAEHVIAVEKDERCIEALQDIQSASGKRLEIIAGDAMDIKIKDMGKAPRRIIANLPYNISALLLLQWLEEIHATPGSISEMILMFQKEVAERLYAKPRTKDYGRLSVMTQWLCRVERLFDLSPSAFTPPPKVDSTVVRITPRADPARADFKAVEKTTAMLFQQRRKMLRGSLKQLCADPQKILAETKISPTARVEELDVETIINLAQKLPD